MCVPFGRECVTRSPPTTHWTEDSALQERGPAGGLSPGSVWSIPSLPDVEIQHFSLKILDRPDRSLHQTSTAIFILKNSAKAQHLYK